MLGAQEDYHFLNFYRRTASILGKWKRALTICLFVASTYYPIIHIRGSKRYPTAIENRTN